MTPEFGHFFSIGALSEDYVRLSETKRAADETLTDTRSDLAEAGETKAALASLPDLAPARAVLKASRRLGDIETVLADSEAQYQAADTQLRADFGSLTLFDGTLESLERLPVPSLETLARFETEYKRVTELRRHLDADRGRVETRLAGHHERLQAPDLADVIPSTADLK